MPRVLRSLGATVLSLGIVVAATGWFYVAQPHVALPGPSMRDALPLDEAAHRSGVPLLLFVAVWAVAATLLAAVARWARTERLTAGLLLAIGVGAWTYAADGFSIFVVRQIPVHEAFHAAAVLQAVYVPAALAGIGGALLGSTRVSARPRAPLVIAWLVAAVGLAGIVDAVFPQDRGTLIDALGPSHVHGLSTALVAPIGFALLVTARGLARRQRRAWLIALSLMAVLTALHIERRFDQGAILTGLAMLALLARRADFRLRGDPSAQPRVAVHALVAAGGILAYGLTTLYLNRLMVAPWRYRVRQEARERELVRSLVAAWGEDTLAPFILRADKSYFFSESERAFLAYRVVGGVAIVSGDPIGPADERCGLVGRFLSFAHERGWRVAVLGVSEGALGIYREHGLHALYHGDEAVIDAESFSLEGRAIRKVRQSVHRLEHAGYRAAVLRPGEIGPGLRTELEAIARALSLSSMPRLRSSPNGFNEWLICETVAWARENGMARVSLNFSPYAALLVPEAELTGVQRVQAAALRSLKGHFQLDNLLLFNRKFFPLWQPRFVVYERRLDLPGVGIAALAAEAYLPFQ